MTAYRVTGSVLRGNQHRQVQALEGLLEVPLFRREGRHIALTDLGAMYQREVSAALHRIQNASLQTISYRTGGGCFHLAALPTFAAKWLMPRLSDFYARHPGTLVHVHSRIGQFDLQLAGMDAVIGVGDGTWPGLVAYPLVDEVLLPVISPTLADRQKVRTAGDIAPLLLLQVTAVKRHEQLTVRRHEELTPGLRINLRWLHLSRWPG